MQPGNEMLVSIRLNSDNQPVCRYGADEVIYAEFRGQVRFNTCVWLKL